MAQRQKRELTYQERLALLKLHSESVDRFLRGGHGACWMKQENIAKEIIKYNLILYGIENYYNFVSKWMKKE